jgi:predicted molibdopterin-dependent oxidoreductase YjgC
MFRRLPEAAAAAAVDVVIDGQPFRAREGDSVAAALIAAGVRSFRATAVGGVPRGPYCLMGVCFDCLVVVDGQRDQQACLIPVAPGMRIDTGRRGERSIAAE